ncbi:MAG: type II toxin-antitoxin system PemK/MazF family toxin [Spirochaetaceae bacterium]|jgi:mRNA interferase MazF|nr:type II toxin-antitoxin system PemK/MazF family toxin [Spirochaetaceae bacterium]
MKRGELYRVHNATKEDPKHYRIFLVVSRQLLIDSRFSTVICAPIYTNYEGYPTQVPLGIDEGLKHESAIYCDNLASLPKSTLTDFVGTLSAAKMQEVDSALRVALQI